MTTEEHVNNVLMGKHRLENNENSKAGKALVGPSCKSAIHAEASLALPFLLSLSEASSLLNILAKNRHLVLHKHK